MKKIILLFLIAFTVISVNGQLNEFDTDSTSVHNINSSDVSYSIKYNEYVKSYFIHFVNTSEYIYDVSFKYYSETHKKYIDNVAIIPAHGKDSACCGERKKIKDLIIERRQE